jgi:hypothetical protein
MKKRRLWHDDNSLSPARRELEHKKGSRVNKECVMKSAALSDVCWRKLRLLLAPAAGCRELNVTGVE